MDMWSRGLVSPLSVSEGVWGCGGGEGVCLRDEAGVGGMLVAPESLGCEGVGIRWCSGCGRRPGRIWDGVG
jgi:hypothetical protein